MDDRTSELQRWIDRLKAGDSAARVKLLECAQERLRKLARKMLRSYPGVQRWEELEDVTQQATLKLWHALQEIAPGSVREFVGLAATQIRRVLIDMARHHFGPEGPGRKHESPAPRPAPPPAPPDTPNHLTRLA